MLGNGNRARFRCSAFLATWTWLHGSETNRYTNSCKSRTWVCRPGIKKNYNAKRVCYYFVGQPVPVNSTSCRSN